MEQQGCAREAERQAAQCIQDHEAELRQAFGHLPGLSLGLFLFKGVDQFDGGEDPDLSAVMFDGLDADGGGGMGFTGARAIDQDYVLRSINEFTMMQCPNSGLLDLAGGKVEAREVFSSLPWPTRSTAVRMLS